MQVALQVEEEGAVGALALPKGLTQASLVEGGDEGAVLAAEALCEVAGAGLERGGGKTEGEGGLMLEQTLAKRRSVEQAERGY